MKDLLVLLAHLLTTIAKLLGPGGARAVVADSLLMKQQLMVINRSRRRAPNLSALDRFLFGFWSLFLNPRRIQRARDYSGLRPSPLRGRRRCATTFFRTYGAQVEPKSSQPDCLLAESIQPCKRVRVYGSYPSTDASQRSTSSMLIPFLDA